MEVNVKNDDYMQYFFSLWIHEYWFLDFVLGKKKVETIQMLSVFHFVKIIVWKNVEIKRWMNTTYIHPNCICGAHFCHLKNL